MKNIQYIQAKPENAGEIIVHWYKSKIDLMPLKYTAPSNRILINMISQLKKDLESTNIIAWLAINDEKIIGSACMSIKSNIQEAFHTHQFVELGYHDYDILNRLYNKLEISASELKCQFRSPYR